MSGAILPTQLADLARGDLAWLRAFLSGEGTRGTSLAAQLDARHDTEKQDTLLTWAASDVPCVPCPERKTRSEARSPRARSARRVVGRMAPLMPPERKKTNEKS